MEDEAWKIIATLGGVQAVATAIILAIWTAGLSWMQTKWAATSSQSLEDLKGEIQKSNSTLLSILGNQSSTYLAAHERRLSALECLWDAFMELKNEFPTEITLMYAILVEEEIGGVLNDFTEGNAIPPLIRKFDPIDYTTKLNSRSSAVEKQRLYIEADAWKLFFAFRALCGRVAIQTYRSITR